MSKLTFFDINHDESILRNLKGNVKDEYRDLFTMIADGSNLKISSSVSVDKIMELCERLLNIYEKDNYKRNFPDIHNIVPEKDPSVISCLRYGDHRAVSGFVEQHQLYLYAESVNRPRRMLDQ